MRDPLRIPRILNKFREIWTQYDTIDLRFGQLFECIVGVNDNHWNIEDDEFEQLLEKWYRRVEAEQQVLRDMNAKTR